MAEDFELGDLVWAKMKGYPPWPAKITEPKEGTPAKSKKPQHFVYFFGTHDVAWVLDELIFAHSEELLENSNNYKKKSATLQTAIDEIKEESLSKPLKVMKDKPSNEDKPISIFGPSKSPKKIIYKKRIVRKRKKRTADEMVDSSEPGCSKVKYTDEDYAHLIANVPPNNASEQDFDDISSGDKDIIDLQEIKPKEPVLPSYKNFGFLGLGVMGSMMVKNLLLSNHNVTVWNRTAEICENFIDMGAKVAANPAEVIRMCDITFTCLEDAEAVKDVVFQKFGVLEGFASGSSSKDGKGYVEMTSVDPTTSQEICEAISCEGGRYLEAPMIGTRQSLSQCAMGLFAAGDRQLFTECGSCFAAIASRAFFLSETTGFASKLNLLTTMVYSTSLAALAESLALAERCGIHPAQFMSGFEKSPLNCKLLMDKGRDMITRNEKVEQPIKHMQKDLDMAVCLSNEYLQPTRVASAVNEMFKRARRISPEGDVSAIYQCYRYDAGLG